MDIQTTSSGDEFIATLSGRLMFSDNPAFRILLDGAQASGAKRCIFDVSALNSVDSAGLGMFVIAADTAKKHGWSLVLRGPGGQVKQLLTLARFDKLLTIQD
jgi:anti-anti-sigma factor